MIQQQVSNMRFRSSTLFLAVVLAVSGCTTMAPSVQTSRRVGASVPGQEGRVPQEHGAENDNGQNADKIEAPSDSASGGAPTLLRGTDRMFAPPKSEPAVKLRGADVSLKFEQAPVAEVVHAVMGDILNVPYSIGQALDGVITLHTHLPLPRDKVFSVFESTLKANGLLVVKDAAGVYHIGRPETLRSVAPSLENVGSLPLGHNMVILPLQYVGAAEMADILKPLATPEAFVRVDTFRNLLILAGTRAQIESWTEIVSTFDIDVLKGMSLGLFPLKHTSAREVDAGLKAVLAGTGSPGGAAAPQPAARPANQGATGATGTAGTAGTSAVPDMTALQISGPVSGVIRIVALDRLNALLVITPRSHYLDTAREWIEKFDQPRSGGSEPQLYVYPIQNGTAQHLANLLNGIFGAGATAQQPQTPRSVAPGLGASVLGGGLGISGSASGSGTLGLSSGRFGVSRLGAGNDSNVTAQELVQFSLGSQVRVVADEQNNAILLYAPPGEYNKIEAALRKLDVAPTQVLIEATILEVTLNDELKYGLQWHFSGKIGSNGWSGQGQLTSGDTSVLSPTNPGFSYSVINPLGQIRAVLNALAQKSLLNVISSPSILVLDNNTAEIHVGDQQPIRTSQTITDGGLTTTSIEYKDTGVKLAVSPSVNAGGMVTMTVEQAVTDVGQVDIATGQRTFLQRQLASRVAVRNGETIVLGGLIRDNNNRDRQGIPLLHDLPILGDLFGTTSDTTVRTELLVMLTPRVVDNDAALRQIGDELKLRMRSLDHLPRRISALRGDSAESIESVPGHDKSTVPIQ
ncbi:type II secretion system secretin GspD [Aromatoleum buckelii]|uniref:Type II secretion system secretin GspD n=1 Tax=Aromatoleum buckelii TaxID=200254 RepID=A0ABX1N472_9RHOO|nr:type II secretion system secretin GspD [Aromatoleum buckelii]MCK0511886.1 type II secretion system secretin GspD [Aromatoleum buckelii]